MAMKAYACPRCLTLSSTTGDGDGGAHTCTPTPLVRGLEAERDRYMRALVHIRTNAESMIHAHEVCAKIAGEFVETPEFINARWNYIEANTALNYELAQPA